MVSFYVCYNDTYTVTVTDVAGNTYQLTWEDTSLKNDTDPEIDGTFEISNMDLENPTLDVTATTPADGDEDVDYKQTEVTLVFDEDVVPQAGETITLTDGNGVEYTYTLTGDEEVTKVVDVEDPSDPDATTYKYELVLDLTDFTATEIDEDGNTVTVTPTYTYQTTAETLYVQDTDEYGEPKEDADGNPVYRVATGTDEGPYYLAETDETSGDIIYTKVTDDEGTLLSGVTGTVTTDEDGNPVLETTSDALEAETTYTITVPTSAFTDAAGNTLNSGTNEDGSISITFTTMEADTENDEWLVEKHLSSIEVAGATVATETVEGTDPQGEPTTTTVTTITVDGTDIYASPDYDEDTLTYSVFLSPDILDEDYLPIMDLIVLVDADEKETDNVTVTVEALDGTLLGDEEETDGVTWTVDSETGESRFIIDKEIFAQVANSFCYINVTTYNHGSTLTYRYLVSIGGLTENTTNQASTDGTVTGVEVTSGTMTKALRSLYYDMIVGGSQVALQFIASVPKEDSIETAVGQITALAEQNGWGNHELFYYDFDLNIISDGIVTPVTEAPDGEIEVVITLPTSMRGLGTYAVFYYHEGEAYKLGQTDDGTGKVVLSGNKLILQTSQYSVYAVTGPEIVEEVEEPEEPTTTVVTKYVNTTTTVTETKTVPSTKTSVVYRSTTASAASDEDEETLIAEAEGSGDTVNAKTDAKTEDEESEDAGDEDGEVSASGLKQGLVLADLLFVVLSLMVAEYSTLRQKKKKRAVNDLLCIGALVLFFVTQPLKGLIGMTDKYTPFFLAILAVQVVVLVLKLKKQDAQTEEVK
ncbi:MAG: Ig-like domain-containing protein [Clostridiales bacterium]|nr:Ig-like domain-containing protein [Clostridiales bacterium]